MESYTTIRISRQVKENLDKITTKDKTYSQTINQLFIDSIEHNVENLIMDGVKSSANYISLEELEAKLQDD